VSVGISWEPTQWFGKAPAAEEEWGGPLKNREFTAEVGKHPGSISHRETLYSAGREAREFRP